MKTLISAKEKFYFILCIIFSLPTYLLIFAGIYFVPKKMLLYIFLIVIIVIIVQGLLIGNIRGNGIKVTHKQFPEIFDLAYNLSLEMGMNKAPDIYILQSGGWLNAFATRFLNRNFVIIFSDVFELAYNNGKDAVAFILCHELAHIKLKHTISRQLLFPTFFFPFLWTAYSRACEYTCDRYGAHFYPDGAVPGLLVLAAGKTLYKTVDTIGFTKQLDNESTFWVWFSEIFSTHPHLLNRIRALGLNTNIISDRSTKELSVVT